MCLKIWKNVRQIYCSSLFPKQYNTPDSYIYLFMYVYMYLFIQTCQQLQLYWIRQHAFRWRETNFCKLQYSLKLYSLYNVLSGFYQTAFAFDLIINQTLWFFKWKLVETVWGFLFCFLHFLRLFWIKKWSDISVWQFLGFTALSGSVWFKGIIRLELTLGSSRVHFTKNNITSTFTTKKGPWNKSRCWCPLWSLEKRVLTLQDYRFEVSHSPSSCLLLSPWIVRHSRESVLGSGKVD